MPEEVFETPTPKKSNSLKYVLLIVLWLVIFVLAPFSLAPVFEDVDVSAVPYILALVARTGSSIMGVTLIIAAAVSILLKRQNKPVKKIWLVAGAILVFVFLVMFIVLMSGVSSIYNLPGQAQRTTKPAISVDERISNWRTYTNRQYGYQFRYPREYSAEEIGGGMSVVFHTQISPKAPLMVDFIEDANPNEEVINVGWFRSFSERLHGGPYEKLPGEMVEEVSVGGTIGVKVVQPLPELNEISVVLFVPSGRDILSATFALPSDLGVSQLVVDGFISTFKFLD